ncbi:MAG TPA: hypothetical protein VGC91_06910 [Pyrinomonadaceae bacterium]|jgi:hypothetical protein
MKKLDSETALCNSKVMRNLMKLFISLSTAALLLTYAAYAWPSCEASQVDSARRRNDELSQVLRQYGAQSLDARHTEFKLSDKVFLRLTRLKNILAAVHVFTQNPTKPYQVAKLTAEQNCRGPYCCLSGSSYNELLSLIDRLKPIGTFRSASPYGVVVTSGRVHFKDDYSESTIVKVGRTSSAAADSPPSDCISEFTIFYWLPLSGRIRSKRAESFELLELKQYFIKVKNSEIGVSQADYERLKVGQTVKLRFTVSNDLAQILEIKN